jgi:hypothetical protein
MRRSKVFVLLSVGMTAGPIDDELKRIVIAISPGMSEAGGTFLPTANERNMKTGNIIPNIRTDGLR